MPSPVLPGLLTLALLGLLAASQGLRGGPAAAPALRAQACDPSQQTCCYTPEGRPVPPGSQRGPYTCLPNGTWG